MARKRKTTGAVEAYPKMDESWRARDDLRTLSSAAEIASDKARMRAAKAEAKRQMTSLQRVAGGAERKKKSRRERLADVQL